MTRCACINVEGQSQIRQINENSPNQFAETMISSFVGTYLKSKLKEEHRTAKHSYTFRSLEDVLMFDIAGPRETPFCARPLVGWFFVIGNF